MELYQREQLLKEEKTALMSSLAIGGRSALSNRAKSEAISRLRDINEEIDSLGQPEPVANPLDTMPLNELKALYESERSAYAEGNGSRDARTTARLLGLNTRIEKLEAEKGDVKNDEN